MVNSTAMTFSGQWQYFGSRGFGDYGDDVNGTWAAGVSASYTFTGTGVDYLSEVNPDQGTVEVYLDGKHEATVDLKGGPPRKAQQVVFSRSGLSAGKHTVKIVNTGVSLGMIDALRIYS
jgi:hypothetical protein